MQSVSLSQVDALLRPGCDFTNNRRWIPDLRRVIANVDEIERHI
jgi:hypothetical protein